MQLLICHTSETSLYVPDRQKQHCCVTSSGAGLSSTTNLALTTPQRPRPSPLQQWLPPSHSTTYRNSSFNLNSSTAGDSKQSETDKTCIRRHRHLSNSSSSGSGEKPSCSSGSASGNVNSNVKHKVLSVAASTATYNGPPVTASPKRQVFPLSLQNLHD